MTLSIVPCQVNECAAYNSMSCNEMTISTNFVFGMKSAQKRFDLGGDWGKVMGRRRWLFATEDWERELPSGGK